MLDSWTGVKWLNIRIQVTSFMNDPLTKPITVDSMNRKIKGRQIDI